MPRKRVNGNIIGARWQDIRHRGEIIAVNRRTGGLEIVESVELFCTTVNRRIGGLESTLVSLCFKDVVNRHIGGL